MRDSNYKCVVSNKAAVTITTSLYDRRALDVTSDKPLVNSLNHLTYLVSSLAKVRETLSVDGGIERLIEILHECHSLTFNLNDTIFNSEKKILTAWKWTLAFQCLVLIGTRGTEAIRQRVVKAGMLPIIATILNNYLTLHERAFLQANRHTGSSFYSRNTPGYNDQLNSQSQEQSQGPQDPGVNPQNDNIDSDTEMSIRNNLSLLAQFSTSPNNYQDNTSTTTAALAASSISNPDNQNNSFFNTSHPSSLTEEDFENLSVEQLFRLIKVNDSMPNNSENYTNSLNNDTRRRFLLLIILKKLKEQKDGELLDNRFSNETEYDMDNCLFFLSDMHLQDDKVTHLANLANSKIAPRNFTETGVVIPRDDDIVWSLQLLAYISKYPYLKDILQNTHLVIDMSVRDKQLKLFIEKQMKAKLKKNLAIKQRPTIKPKSRKSKLNNMKNDGSVSNNTNKARKSASLGFSPSPSSSPQMINSLRDENFILDQDKLDLYETSEDVVDETLRVTGDTDVDNVPDNLEESDPESGSVSDSGSEHYNDNQYFTSFSNLNQNRLSQLYESIIDAESIVDDLDRDIVLNNINDKINKHIASDCKSLSLTITRKRLEQKQYLGQKWDYDTYDNFDIDNQNCHGTYSAEASKRDPDFDDCLIEYKKVNLFPMVEKFTFLAGTDMYYWSGVIMRNSCRRNELRGGVRQCGNLDCGKWESYPREFLKCRRCKRTKYCSRECQMRAWHCHRNWCIPSTNSTGGSTTASTGAEGDETNDNEHGNVVIANTTNDGNNFAMGNDEINRNNDAINTNNDVD